MQELVQCGGCVHGSPAGPATNSHLGPEVCRNRAATLATALGATARGSLAAHMGKRSPSEDSDGSRERRRRKQKRAKAKEKDDSDGEGRRKRKKEKRSRSRSTAYVETKPHRPSSASRPAD
jgi:hypothetical protein